MSFNLRVYHVVVYADGCINGELRLVEGETEWEGRLEVCFGQRWGTVSNDGWTKVNNQVVCNSFGYDFTGMPGNIISSNIIIHVPIPCPFIEGALFFLLHYPQIIILITLYLRHYQSQSTYTTLSAQVKT